MSLTVPAEQDLLAPFDLSPERRRVAETCDRHVVALAGPGAGKTHLLAAHACWLARHQSGRVIMLTFTKKAAGEMSQRISRALPPLEARRVLPSTLHAYAMALLRAHGHWIGLPPKIQPLVSREVQDLANHVAAEHGLPRMNDFASRFERYQRLGGNVDAPNAPALLPLVVEEMRRSGNLGWETCTRFATQLLLDHPEVRDSVRHHDRSLLLDEAQDCDPAQLAFIDAVVGGPNGPGHLFAVMDPDQSLYAFRDADPDRVRAWAAGYSAEAVVLSENFRCQPRIQGLANRVLGRAAEGARTGGTTSLLAASDIEEEARLVTVAIRERIAGPRHVDPDRLAILARRRTRLSVVEAAVRAAGLSVRTDPEARWDESEEGVLLALRFLAEWRDGAIVSRSAQPFLQRAARLEPADARKIEADALASGVHPGDALDHDGWRDLRAWLEASRHTPLEIVRFAAQSFAIELEEASALTSLATHVRSFADLLRAAQAGPPAWAATSKAGVLVTTFHGAKGLEFDTVFLVGCEDGVVPDFRARSDADEKTERRSLYVAVTRAETEVIASWARKGPNGHAQSPCPFLPPAEDPVWGGDE